MPVTMVLVGDVMLGRLIDAALQRDGNHVVIQSELKTVLEDADAVMANLECCISDRGEPWPKRFTFRSEPQHFNEIIRRLRVKQWYWSLANNHLIDYGYKAMSDTTATLASLKQHAFSGIGATREEAMRPAEFSVNDGLSVAAWSASDHPEEWAACSPSKCNHIPTNHAGIFYLDASERPEDLQAALANERARNTDAFMTFSFHWGPNFALIPSIEIQEMAHWLVDQGVRVIHGHSAHHPQGIELYHDAVIIYGCGDFVDDYAVDEEYRNDLGFVYRLCFSKDATTSDAHWPRMDRIEVLPIRISNLSVNLMTSDDPDLYRHCQRMIYMCEQLGTHCFLSDDTQSHPCIIIPIPSAD